MDSDGDNVGDLCDNCPATANVDQVCKFEDEFKEIAAKVTSKDDIQR